ncbi:uncharacterized protein Dana_GF19507 [Drosophila ananassae]|uniref:Putative ionotropic receptor ligand binding domain-containing protein n=1 Tax=Drosophila ananassae TaxID=7217 RepID=B3MXR1_DROAN|nr:uncharacterized protein LOC6502264 [Drosophila ananassae]EDV38526.1 uncharacterized protein Dana_GF19507 [Drosophila ananassae]
MRLVGLCLLSALWLLGNSQDQRTGQELLLAKLTPPQDEMKVQVLAKATHYVVKNFIANKINTMVIRQDCMECPDELLDRQSTIVDHVLSNLAPNISVVLHSGDDQEETSWDYTLFVVNSQREFLFLKIIFPDELVEREFYFVVVVTQFQSPDTVEATVGKIIVASLRFPVINVVVVVQTTDGTVVLYAYSLFTTNCTIGLTLLEINQFDPVTGEPLQPMTYLYPVRQGHLGNCVLNVTANHMPPHFIYEKWTEERNSYPENQVVDPKDVSGIDWEVLQLLSKALKFKIQLLLPSEPSQIFGEGNVTGSFAQLADGSAQLAVGGLSGSDKRRWLFSKSTVYYQSQFVMVVRRDRYLGRFGPLMLPFRGKVWTMIILIYATAFVATFALSSRLRLRYSLENLFLMTLGNPIPMHRLPGTGFLRYLVASWLLLTLVLRGAYQARLFDVLRMQQYRPLPKDVAGLIEDNYTLVSNGYHDFYPLRMTRRMSESFSARFDRVQHAAPGERLTSIALVSNLAYWNHRHRDITRLTFVPQPIYTYQLVLYFPRRSFLKPAVDRKLKQLLGAGVIAQIGRRYVNYLCDKDLAGNRELLPRITNKLMGGVYRIHALVIFLATVVFGLERISHRWSWLTRLMEWFHRY